MMYAAWGQGSVGEAPISVIFATEKEKGIVNVGLGHAAENLYLQAAALGSGTVAVGSFRKGSIKEILSIKETPICIMPVGKK